LVKKVESKKTTVRLVGGLGNQLFIYFAGLYVSRKAGTKLVCDLSYLDTDVSKHGVAITSFDLEGVFVRHSKWKINTKIAFNRIISFLSIKSNHFTRIYQYISRTHVSQGIGYDADLEIIRPDLRLFGYFQTWKYARAVNNQSQLALKIKNPSDWFIQLKSIAEHEQPIMIHVRHGDYYQEQNSFIGVLGASYYKNAIREVRAAGLSSPIWVFSNDVESARKLLSPHLDREVTWVVSPAGTDAAEELALMQFGGAHIIANSTFSWWGAFLSRSTKIVIAPRAWFKDQREPLDLIPPEWRRIENDWI
jgi:hypothetical protein